MNTMKEVFPNNTFFMDVTYFQLVLRVLACITVRRMLPATSSSPPPSQRSPKNQGLYPTSINGGILIIVLLIFGGYFYFEVMFFLLMTSIEANKLVLYGSSFGCSGQSVIRRPSGSVLQ